MTDADAQLIAAVERAAKAQAALREAFKTDKGIDDAVHQEASALEALPCAALLARLRELVEREKTVERDQGKLIDERDAAEEAMSQAYYLIVGKSPEWSNLFGYPQALEEIDEAQTLLRTKIKEQADHLAARSALDAGKVVRA